MAALDLQHSRRRSASVFGPTDVPPRDVVIARLTAMAAAGPAFRIGLTPSTTEIRWRRALSDISGSVTEADEPDGDPLALLDILRELPETGLRVVLAGDHMAIDFSHGLGDVALSQAIVDVVIGGLPVTDTHWSRYQHRISPLAVASARTFGSDPRRLRDLLRFHRSRPAPEPVAAVTTHPMERTAPSACTIRIPDDEIDALRSLRDRNLPGVSMFAIYTCALLRAFDGAGIPFNPEVILPFDARPYLPKRLDTLASFSAGLAFGLHPGTTPTDLQAMLSESAAMGRPVANLLVSTCKIRLAGRSRLLADPWELPDTPQVAADFLHSFVGRLPQTDYASYTDASRAINYTVSDPVSPTGITVTTAMVGEHAICMSAAFFDSVFDPQRVEQAMSAVLRHARGLVAA
ncbi:hypothetical protein AAFP30_22595 [Gordonia sp. CPCC 205515]|uniref:hypothetical protein n=1 Tax=Gordonia sp. CPCC 205515 TaxID=3140791 RepID=UPI003AF34887